MQSFSCRWLGCQDATAASRPCVWQLAAVKIVHLAEHLQREHLKTNMAPNNFFSWQTSTSLFFLFMLARVKAVRSISSG